MKTKKKINVYIINGIGIFFFRNFTFFNGCILQMSIQKIKIIGEVVKFQMILWMKAQ